MFDSYQTSTPEKVTYNWEQVFAWLPVAVHGKRKWFTKVWRRKVAVYGDERNMPLRYQYGNIFDVIKDEE